MCDPSAPTIPRMTNIVIVRSLAFALFALWMLSGCAKSERSFLIVQVCLTDEHEMSDFVELMEVVANSERMKFVDRSTETQGELKTINNANVKQASPAINLGILGADGVGLTAGNLGLPPNELAVGFTGVSRLPQARQFADMVVSRLKEVWHIEIVPEGRAATAMRNCKH
jgi:hypothetical protein